MASVNSWFHLPKILFSPLQLKWFDIAQRWAHKDAKHKKLINLSCIVDIRISIFNIWIVTVFHVIMIKNLLWHSKHYQISEFQFKNSRLIHEFEYQNAILIFVFRFSIFRLPLYFHVKYGQNPTLAFVTSLITKLTLINNFYYQNAITNWNKMK